MKTFIQKYAPKEVNEIIGQNAAMAALKHFLDSKKKAAILYGPPGTGKTSAIYVLANELNLEVVEVNASDARNKDSINSLVGSAANQRSLFHRGKLILVDEIDGLSGRKDRGGAIAIVNILEKSVFPIIMTANDPFDKKLSQLRKKSEMIQFHTLNYISIANMLKKICKKEEIKCDELTINMLARSAGGDMRAAINDLQILSHSGKIIKEDVAELSQRNKEQTMINALMMILKTDKLDIALKAFDNVGENIDKRFLWLDENLPKEYTKPADLMRAYNMMSRADVFKGRIRRWQHWHFLVYINKLLSGGIALSKDEKYKGFSRYGPTKRILKLWKAKMSNARRDSISVKIAGNTHVSLKEAKQTMPYVKKMFSNKKMAQQITEDFDLSEEEIDWLKR